MGWWNGGSQIYCWPLGRGEKLLRERDYQKAIDEGYTPPFKGVTDAKGKATIDLPVGREDLEVISDVYELPVFLGRRNVRINLSSDKASEVTLNLQPTGHGEAWRLGQAGGCGVWLFDARGTADLRVAGSAEEDG